MKKPYLLLFSSTLLLSSAFILTSCGEIATPYTDNLKLEVEYGNKEFIRDGIGLISVVNVTDGDTLTARPQGSINPNDDYPVRFLGVNTPESTATVEPWGKPASVWVGEKLAIQETTEIVLINDRTVFETTDSNARYLAFVWYRHNPDDDFRLLNLELLEQGYSKNQLFVESELCPYVTDFVAASQVAQTSGLRVWGQQDPGFDYSGSILEPNIRKILEQFDHYGISSVGGGNSGKALRMTGVVVGMISDNLILRDLSNPYPSGEYASIYCYAGFGSRMIQKVKTGDIIQFTCRAGIHADAIQLTDINADEFPVSENSFKVLARYADIKEMNEAQLGAKLAEIQALMGVEETLGYSYTPVERTFEEVREFDDFTPDNGLFIDTYVKIRQYRDSEPLDKGELSEDRNYRRDVDHNVTVYAYPATVDNGVVNVNENVSLNLYINGSLSMRPSIGTFALDNVVHIKGYLSNYYERYQITLFNNDPRDPCYPYVASLDIL